MRISLETPLTAKIVEWDDQKGYGFLQVGTGRVFLHRRDFSERHKRPAVGDSICFKVGVDAQGRTCAKEAVHENDGGRVTPLAILVLAALLVLPALALYRSGADLRWVGGFALVLNGLSYGCYAVDKHRARTKQWRIDENGLHLLELLGGWPGAWIAQRRLRHKCSKVSFQLVFWLIVLAWQIAAFDSFQDWKFSRPGLKWIEHLSERQR